jgi:hypothetical protein
LLHDLYLEAGVSVVHIEMLTGHPAATLNRVLRRLGIDMRTPGGRCPFLRRWRARPDNPHAPVAGVAQA